jgi:hypothetical protein
MLYLETYETAPTSTKVATKNGFLQPPGFEPLSQDQYYSELLACQHPQKAPLKSVLSVFPSV